MESYCNNRNSMNCARVHTMRNCDDQASRCNQTAQNRERIAQQHTREERMEQCKREDKMEQRRRENRMTDRCDRDNRSHNRNVEVECVCQMKSAVDCHRHDKMEHLGCEFPVVMAYVPWQQWGDMYEAECGLMQGTIFKDLNFIFCGERC